MKAPTLALLTAAALAACAGPASACPHCDAGVRQRVWAGVFGEGFVRNVLVSAAPFAVFGLAAAALHGRPGGGA